MDLTKKTELLKKLLPQVAPAGMVESQGDGLESLGLPDAQTEAAVSGFEKLAVDETLDAPQADALEAIIHKQFRPAVFVINDTYEVPPAPWEGLAERENQARITAAIRSIGRIELPGMVTIPYGGTGFVVGTNLVMTNRHVAEIFARGLGQRQLSFKPNRGSAINFRREVEPSSQVPNLSVQEVLMIHPYWDMALLRVEGLSQQQAPLTISARHPDELAGRDVVVIGYPAKDPRNEVELQNRIFAGVFDVKRMQPGYLRKRRKIRSFANAVEAVTHDASTLGGNSGSAVVDVATGQVLALHFAGLYLDANFAVPGFELARDSRVVDAGVNFSETVEPTSDWAEQWRLADRPVEAARRLPKVEQQPAPAPAPNVLAQGNSATWTIPLNITISLGGSQVSSGPGAGVTPPPKQLGEVEEGWFGESTDQMVARAYRRFSTRSLKAGFSWAAVLSTGVASHLAYENANRVTTVCQNQLGFEDCEFIRANDTECFVASTASEVLLAFRGTAGTADWIRDLTLFSTDVDYGSVHQGFYFGVQQAKPQIENLLTRFNAKNKKLVVTGHSLGGALAAIAAADFDNEFPVTAVYTFGQPAVGRRNFRNFMQRFSSRFFRIVNDDDIVTMVPPGYVHVGKLYRFGYSGSVSHETVTAAPDEAETPTMSEAEFRSLQEECAMAEPTESMPIAEEGLLPGPSFLDHRLTSYLSKTLKQLD